MRCFPEGVISTRAQAIMVNNQWRVTKAVMSRECTNIDGRLGACAGRRVPQFTALTKALLFLTVYYLYQ
jgi:hypothetical protein